MVTLENIPSTPKELEDYVAALFQASGHFIEKNIIERDFALILELDAVVTSYQNPPPVSCLIEAKSGDWGFPDLFKLAGWLRYLDYERGLFFASKEQKGHDVEAVNTKLKQLGISVLVIGDFSDTSARLCAEGFPPIRETHVFDVSRWSYWMEWTLVNVVRLEKRRNPTLSGPSTALQYHMLINNGVFFTTDIHERAYRLYEAFRKHPHLSLGIAREISGLPFETEEPDPRNPTIREALLEGKHPLLQACFYFEHRARLALLKAAIDSTLILDERVEHVLPGTFLEGLERLKQRPYYHLYPLFWQLFLWVFGGFIIQDRAESEYQWLASSSGLPAEHVPEALEAFDILFPTPLGWLATPGATQCRRVKMMPRPLMGIGALLRRKLYNIDHYAELGHTDYTGNDLTNWHNAAVRLLESDAAKRE